MLMCLQNADRLPAEWSRDVVAKELTQMDAFPPDDEIERQFLQACGLAVCFKLCISPVWELDR